MRSRAILLPRRTGSASGLDREVGVDHRRDVDGAGLEAEALGHRRASARESALEVR